MKFALLYVSVLAVPFVCGVLLARGAIAVGSEEPARASQAGGLSLAPPVVEQKARAGASASVTVTNATRHSVRVTLRSRPWLQAADATVSPDPHRTLSRLVRVVPANFTMAPGSQRRVRLTLRRHPSGGSLYGAIDLTGIPRGQRLPNGITPRYRLIGSLRLNPFRARMRVRAGALKITGRPRRQAIVLPLRNLGNTVEPIRGRVVLTGARGVRPNTLRAVRIVPRRRVQLTLGTYRGLLRGQPAGRYSIAVTLTQAGRTVLRTSRGLRLR